MIVSAASGEMGQAEFLARKKTAAAVFLLSQLFP